ncbi:hypothetical protein GO730_19470 [Spirosoma sp. HMF3257]|uniref:Uncharacterized protein n=1 Tax=Spirosoma telluris TaxID=2183553 RepID=A0A327NLW6_9BACT|nr:hypothetical protein [Spirosoma telluris]RAI75783.1 hypothetical protein HMF3257_19400 [Spirosoma telluris]
MKKAIVLSVAALCLFLSSCHRPVAYFQRSPHPAAARLAVEKPTTPAESTLPDSSLVVDQPMDTMLASVATAVASLKKSSTQSTNTTIGRRMHRIQSMLSSQTESTDKQPDPKPKKKLRLGNQIRQSLGMRLRPELNWWQRISWKLKASVLIILVAVVFAILHVTILAIIFGILGAFLMISGLKRSFKVRRPWF